MKYSLVLLLLFTITSCNAPKHPASTVVRPAIRKIVDSMAHGGMLKAEHAGWGNRQSDQWKLFERPSALASAEELKTLFPDLAHPYCCIANKRRG